MAITFTFDITEWKVHKITEFIIKSNAKDVKLRRVNKRILLTIILKRRDQNVDL